MIAERRTEVLKQAWALQEQREYVALRDLLQPLPENVVVTQEPELGYLLAVAYHRLGRDGLALELLQRIAEVSRRWGNTRLVRARANLEGVVLLIHGRLAEAEDCFQRVAALAGEVGDEYYVANAFVNLAVVADIRCQWEKALASSQRAIASLHRQGRKREIGSVHHNLGMSYRQLGLYTLADSHFQHAYRIFHDFGSVDEMTIVEIERALLLGHMGDARLAQALAKRALERAREIGSERDRGEALRVLGKLALQRRDNDAARDFLERALEVARDTHNVMLEAEVAEEQAVLAQDEGDSEGMLQALERAVQAYDRLGATARSSRVIARLSPEASNADFVRQA